MPPPVKGQAYYKDGTPIPEADLSKAIAAGSARWRKGETIPFAAPDGSGWDIPAEHAQAQIAKGWRPVTADEQAVETARRESPSVLQVLGGAALGLGDALPGGRLVTDRFVDEQERAVIEARTPIAKATGEGIGFGAPLLAGGPLARIATAIAGPAVALSAGASRLGAMAASRVPTALAGVTEFGVASGIEGATYAAGNELARQARGNQDFNAEAFASAIGEGGLFGVAAGTGVAGARGLARSGAKRGADAYRGLMRGLSSADDAAAGAAAGGAKRLTDAEAWRLKSVGITPGQHKNIKPEVLARAAQELKDLGIVKQTGAWAAASEDIVTKAHKLNKALEELGDTHIPAIYKEADALLGKMPDMHPTARAVDALSSSAQLARKTAVVKTLTDRTAMLYDKTGEYATVAAKLEKSWLGPLQKARTIDELHKLDIDLRKTAEGLKAGSIGQVETSLFRGDLKSKIRELIGEMSPELGTKLRKADGTYEALSAIRKPVTDAAASGQARTVSGLTPYEATLGAGGLAFGSPGIGAVLAGAHAGVRHLKASDRFAAAMSVATDAAANVATKKRFTISGAIKAAAEKSPVKITPGTPGRLIALTRDYHEKTEAAKQSVTNPQPTLVRLANNLAPLARVNPDQARRMAELYSNDLAWLAARVPPGWSNEDDLDFMLKAASERAQSVPPSVANKFVRVANVLADPLKQVEKVNGKGKSLPAPETAEVLRERRPETRNQVEREFDEQAMKLAAKGQKMTYKTRIQASLLTGKAYDPSMRPESIQFNQSHWKARFTPAPATGSGKPPAKRGRVTQTTRGRVTRFNTTAQQTMEPSEL